MAYISLNFLFRQRLFLLIALLFFQFDSTAQNLVPNPSFEELDSCITNLTQMERAVGWKSVLNTPDCFSDCAIGRASVPNNQFGYQNPINIENHNYAGLLTGLSQNGVYQEAFGISLNESLQVGVKYYISFYVSEGFNKNLQINCKCFVSNLGIKFMTSFTDTINLIQRLVNNTATVFSVNILSDTISWTKLSFSFIADSNYTFLVIGNFYTKNNIQINCLDSNSNLACTFIDEICLSKVLNDCRNENNSNPNIFQIYPTLGSGVITIKSTSNIFEQKHFKIYNLLGQVVFESTLIRKEEEYDLNILSKGIYFILIDEFIFKIILI